MRTRSFYMLILLAISSLYACSENYVLEENFTIPNQTWTYQDSMLVKVPVTDTKQRYNLYLDVAHGADYAYQNLYVRINTQFPSGRRVSDKVSLELADETGQWYGKCSSESCLLRIALQEHIYFKEAGEHLISIEQYMREEGLAEIYSLSFKIAPSEVK